MDAGHPAYRFFTSVLMYTASNLMDSHLKVTWTEDGLQVFDWGKGISTMSFDYCLPAVIDISQLLTNKIKESPITEIGALKMSITPYTHPSGYESPIITFLWQGR